jgi:protein-disulfide isomerase
MVIAPELETGQYRASLILLEVALAYRWQGVAALVWGALLAACTRPSLDAKVARLAARVDSLAVAVTTMKNIIEGGSIGAELPETSTVGSVGVAALGSNAAPVTIVEFTDYQCPFCARHARETFPRLNQEYVARGKVRYVVRDLPLPFHTYALSAAKAARCAGAQGASEYWRFHDELFASQSSLADSSLPKIARRARLDTGPFSKCMQSNSAGSAVQKDLQDAEKAGLRETPSFVIGQTLPDGKVRGVILRGAQPYDRFKVAIDGVLRTATKQAPS